MMLSWNVVWLPVRRGGLHVGVGVACDIKITRAAAGKLSISIRGSCILQGFLLSLPSIHPAHIDL